MTKKKSRYQFNIDYPDILRHICAQTYPDKKVMEATGQVTENCSLACTYCYEYEKTPATMSLETAKKYTDCLFETYSDTHFAIICDFIGGEPLLEADLISHIIDYGCYQCIMHMDTCSWYKFITYSLCTNGTEYFKESSQKLFDRMGDHVSFTVSIDGNKELHDSARVHFDGRGSYDEAISAANDYETKKKLKLGSKMTISPNNIGYLYSALKHYLDTGADDIHANVVYEDVGKPEDATFFYNELKKLADYKLQYYPDIYISLFEEEAFRALGKSDTQPFCGGRGSMIACAPDGTIYPCIRYTPVSVGHNRTEYITMGNVDTGIDFAKVDAISKLTRRDISDDECYYCPIAMGCGECAAYSWQITGRSDTKVKFICKMHQARALANVYYGNKYYQLKGENKHFINRVPEAGALEIIDKDELVMLYELSGQNKINQQNISPNIDKLI